MVNKLRLVSLGVYHQNCVSSETTFKFPEITLTQASSVTILKKKNNKLNYSVLWTIDAPTPDYLEKYLFHLKNHHETSGLDILQKNDASAFALQRIRGTSCTYDEVMKKGFVYTEPISVKNGYEIHTAITKDEKGIKKSLDELSAIGEVKLLKASNFFESKRPYNLTVKQLKALKIANSNGYYSWPKKTNLEKMSFQYGATRRGFQESLRKAESKIFPELIKNILN